MSDRRPLTLVELRHRVCGLVYGEAPCTAAVGVTGERKCFNTRKTCQDPENFAPTTRTLRFSEGTEDVPLEWDAIPSVRSVRTRPTRLNVAGLSGESTALGMRGTVTITLADHPDGDTLTDPYVAERDYEPNARGTFWGKFLARTDDWEGAGLEVFTFFGRGGVIEPYNQPFSDGAFFDDGAGWDEERSLAGTGRFYWLENISGPDNRGMVQVTGRDILSRADGRKAQAPRPVTGTLSLEATPEATVIDAIGLDQDESAFTFVDGTIRIGRELIRYEVITTDGLGRYRFTNCQRGSDGTAPAQHAAGASIQPCLRFSDAAPAEIMRTLLVDYADVPGSWVPDVEWDAEQGRWLAPYSQLSAVISEPTAVLDLLAEIAESAMLSLWVDERAQKIRLRAVRAPEGEVYPITDEAHILAGSVNRSLEPDEQITAAQIYYGVIDATEKVDEIKNYRSTRAVVGRQIGPPRIRQIFSRWLQTGRQASLTGRTLLRASNATPVYINCSVGAKDLEIWTGAVVDLTTRLVQDETGAESTELFQVIEATENAGRTMAVTMRTFGAFPRVSLWAPAGMPDFDSATDEQKGRYAWAADAAGMLDGARSPYVWGA